MADDELTLNNNSRFQLVQPFEAKTVAESTNGQSLEIKPLETSSETAFELKPVTTSQTVEIKPLQTSSNDTIELRPVRVDARQEVAYTEPIRTDANSTLDLKPVALDVVVRSGQTALPSNHVCQPYQHRVGMTVLGVEWLGLAWSGESQTIIDDRPHAPSTVWGPVMPVPQPHERSPYPDTYSVRHPRSTEPRPRNDRRHDGDDTGGLRIHLR